MIASDSRKIQEITALIKDPFGYRWAFNQKIEDVSAEELARRAQEFFAA